MRNRRNYYRILHVQRDAPAELIKSCYRALMRTLEMHPDRGGDHWNAALLNEAYAVLSDTARRDDYDRTLGQPGRATARPPGPSEPTSPRARRVALAGHGGADGFCAFCGQTHAPDGERCVECDSPLTMSTEWAGGSSGRRARNRLSIDREVVLHTDWPSARPRRARVRDLSPGGLRLEVAEPIEQHHIVKLNSEMLHAVARVAHCRPACAGEEPGVVIGVEFFTLRLPQTRGVFLSVSG